MSILELERLLPMDPTPTSAQILHMVFVIVAFSAAGIMTKDVNKHNWGSASFRPTVHSPNGGVLAISPAATPASVPPRHRPF